MSEGSEEPAPVSRRVSEGPRVLTGIAGSPGVATGPVTIIDTGRVVVHRHVRRHLAEEELQRFDGAAVRAAHGLRETAQRMQTVATRAEASILEAYAFMVEDEMLRAEVARRIRIDGQCAEWALESAVLEMSAQLRTADDPYLRERSHDVEFVMDRILEEISGRSSSSAWVNEAGSPRIIVARDLSPAETARFRSEKVLAIVTETGTRTSHTSIIARALEIPAVVGVADVISQVRHGETLIVDGVRGRVTLGPTDAMIAEAESRALRRSEKAHAKREIRGQTARTSCGVALTVRGNIELAAEAEIALAEGAEGIGLYRTEFLYLNRTSLPSEAEQYETYRQVLTTIAPLPVALRTFDMGGDKMASAFHGISEKNPALGRRAVRLGLEHPEIFLEQLRAMVRASAHGQLGIMVPMISALSELRAVRGLLTRAIREVDERGQARAARIPLGMMVEVPSAAILAQEFAREAEFFSIGTNDLVQYTMAVDRTSRELEHLAKFLDPSVLRLVDGVIRAGRAHGRPVAVCGAMASDPLAAVMLIGMGLRELSMEASAISDVKEALSRVTLLEAEEAARAALEQSSAADVELCLAERFAERFVDLLDNEA